MDLDMNIPIPSVLFGLGGKCVLNWALVLFQKEHIRKNFVCVYGLSLAIADTVLTLAVSFIHLHEDSNVLGWRLTRYHVCLFVQILGFVYSAQHFSVLVMTAMEHLYTVWRRSRRYMWKPSRAFQLFLTLSTWAFSTFFVLKLSNVHPYLEDAAHFQIEHCWTSSSYVVSELAVVTGYLCLGWILCLLLKLFAQLAKNPYSSQLMTMKSQIRPRAMFITKVAKIFLDTWALFLIFLILQVVLPMKMPSHLGLNCAWLCFTNSLFIAVALCVLSPASELAQGLAVVPPDSFCDWKTQFSSAFNGRHEFTVRKMNK